MVSEQMGGYHKTAERRLGGAGGVVCDRRGTGGEAAGAGMGFSLSPGVLWVRRAQKTLGRRVAAPGSMVDCAGRSTEGDGPQEAC